MPCVCRWSGAVGRRQKGRISSVQWLHELVCTFWYEQNPWLISKLCTLNVWKEESGCCRWNWTFVLSWTDATATSEYTQEVYQGSKWVHCMQQMSLSFIMFECYTDLGTWNGMYTSGPSRDSGGSSRDDEVCFISPVISLCYHFIPSPGLFPRAPFLIHFNFGVTKYCIMFL